MRDTFKIILILKAIRRALAETNEISEILIRVNI